MKLLFLVTFCVYLFNIFSVHSIRYVCLLNVWKWKRELLNYMLIYIRNILLTCRRVEEFCALFSTSSLVHPSKSLNLHKQYHIHVTVPLFQSYSPAIHPYSGPNISLDTVLSQNVLQIVLCGSMFHSISNNWLTETFYVATLVFLRAGGDLRTVWNGYSVLIPSSLSFPYSLGDVVGSVTLLPSGVKSRTTSVLTLLFVRFCSDFCAISV